MRFPKLCFVSQFSVTDPKALSGTNKTIYDALCLYSQVSYVAPIKQAPSRLIQIRNKISRFIPSHSVGLPYHTWANIYKMSKDLQAHTQIKDCSHILCPSSLTAAACLKAGLICATTQLFLYSDATVKCLHGYYPEWHSIFATSFKEACQIEDYVYSGCSRIIMASQWAANSIVSDYNIKPSKVYVAPRAANLRHDPGAFSAEHLDKRRLGMNIVIIAKNWKRKGVKIAIDAIGEIRKRGMNARLVIIGLDPKEYSSFVPRYVTSYPFINKQSSEGWSLYEAIMRKCAIFIFPTQAEAMGISLTEACAFSMPIIANDTGGVSTVVNHNHNGILLHKSSTYYEYADALQAVLLSKTMYNNMSFASRFAYTTRFTFDALGTRLMKIIND
jgi:glycosyltransferase involved in cell wall biosynthesis